MDFDFKKIELDKDTYIKYWDKDNFELHIRASGPLVHLYINIKMVCLNGDKEEATPL